MRHAPSLAAEEAQALLDAGEDMVIPDARRFEQHQVMNVPGSVGVPGAELALRVRDLAPAPATRVIVNCAGHTRSIIGTQSLVNAGILNRVAALRDGRAGFFDGRLCPLPRAGRLVRCAPGWPPAWREWQGRRGRARAAWWSAATALRWPISPRPACPRWPACRWPCWPRHARLDCRGTAGGDRAVRQAAPAIDRYRRPYEGTDNKAKAMQAYLDWEFGLVAGTGRHARLSVL